MKRCNIITTGVLALALALPVSGCFGLGNTESDNFTDSLLDMAEDATKIAEDLQDVEWGKLSRAVVRNAATGDVVAEITDQPTIEAAFEPLSKVNGIAPKPEEPEEYIIEVWQPSTIKLGEDSSDTYEIQALEVITHEGSEVVTLTVSPISLTINLVSTEDTTSALRVLASGE